MSIFQEGVRSNYKSEQDKAFDCLLETSEWIRSIQQNQFDAFDLTAVQYEILKLLCDADGIPLSMDTLQKRTILHKQFTFEEIDPLAQRALIEVICDTAGVPYMLRIQAGGKEIVKDIEFRTNPDLEIVKGKINSNEARILNLLLDKLKA